MPTGSVVSTHNTRESSISFWPSCRKPTRGGDETLTLAKDIEFGVDEKYHTKNRGMLKKHESMWYGQLGEISAVEHPFDFGFEARPFRSAPRRAGPKTRELEISEIYKQLNAGVIEFSQSAWAGPGLFFFKKDWKLRFCINYKKLNSLSAKVAYPLHRMDHCIDLLG